MSRRADPATTIRAGGARRDRRDVSLGPLGDPLRPNHRAIGDLQLCQHGPEAVGKWRRARLSSAQLSTYYYGFAELMKIRTQLEAAPGFSERAYHDRLLSYGSPALRHIRELMLAR